MLQARKWMVLAAAVVGMVWAGSALSQETRPERRGDREQRGERRSPEQMRERMEEFRKQAEARMREQLGASEEEWKVLQPKIEKVTMLRRQLMLPVAAGRGMMMGRGRAGERPEGRDRRPDDDDQPDREQSPLQKASAELRKTVNDKEASPAQLKSALAEYREARDKVRNNLEGARKDLREVVTLRQEAVLVGMELLE